MLRRSHLPPFSKPPEGNGTTLGTTSRPALMLARASPQNRDISISRLYPSHPVVLRSAAPTSTSPSPPPEGYGTTSRPGLRLSRASPRGVSAMPSPELFFDPSGCGQNHGSGSRSPPGARSPAHVNAGARSPRTSTPVLHPRPSNTSLQMATCLPGQDLDTNRSFALRFAWDWVRRRVIGPLENLMRRMGWRVEATLTARLNITTRSGDVFNQSLPLRLALPHNVVAAPGEGAEQV
ncbi:hypothetical protein EDB85DRAFT_1899911 [Lactarius pseudohatsudake]|nr:hypothetical protein EDB85DRAFT_1899911 [Lactarius pseudohatsudake]